MRPMISANERHFEDRIMKPTLSVVVPTRDDYYGCWNTVASLLDHHGHQVDEIIVVDNGPKGSEHSALLKAELTGLSKVRLDRIIGPESSCKYKDRGIRLATSEVVICCDSHVLFPSGPVPRCAIQCVLNFFERNPESIDLLMGPICKQPGKVMATQQMLYAWEADQPGSKGIPSGAEVLNGVVCRGGNLGAWANDPRGLDPDGEPYEIQQQGTGAFAIRKAAWTGWPGNFHGHGGNETFLMESIRQRGGKVLCHPGFRWTHNFGRTHQWEIEGRPSKVPYRMNWEPKVANYLMGFVLLDKPQLYSAIAGHLTKHCPKTIKAATKRFRAPKGWLEKLEPQWRKAGGDQGGAVPRVLFHMLRQRLHSGMITLEFGSGLSTLLFDAMGTDHTAIEHNLTWYNRVAELKTRETTKLIASNITEGKSGEKWFEWRPEPGYQADLVLIDGPPGQIGRAGCRHYLADILAPNATIILDDTQRPDEQQLSDDLAAMYGFTVQRIWTGKRAFDILTRAVDTSLYDDGVGSELSAILKSRWRIEPQQNCGCNGRIREMNYRGAEWCRHNVDKIVGWLLDGASHWKAENKKTWLAIVPEFAERMYLTRLVNEAVAAFDGRGEVGGQGSEARAA